MPANSDAGQNGAVDAIVIGNLEIRPAEYEVIADGERVGLTVREFEAFLVLVDKCDRVVPRPRMYTEVWGGQMSYRDRSVDVVVRKVRNKLRDVSPNWTYISPESGFTTCSVREPYYPIKKV